MSHPSAARPLRVTLAGAASLFAAFALSSPATAASFDGVYSGKSAVTVGAGNTACGKDINFKAQVSDNTFLYTWDGANKVIIKVRIAADGTVTGEGGAGTPLRATASGKLTGKNLEVDLKGAQCARHLSLKMP